MTKYFCLGIFWINLLCVSNIDALADPSKTYGIGFASPDGIIVAAMLASEDLKEGLVYNFGFCKNTAVSNEDCSLERPTWGVSPYNVHSLIGTLSSELLLPLEKKLHNERLHFRNIKVAIGRIVQKQDADLAVIDKKTALIETQLQKPDLPSDEAVRLKAALLDLAHQRQEVLSRDEARLRGLREKLEPARQSVKKAQDELNQGKQEIEPVSSLSDMLTAKQSRTFVISKNVFRNTDLLSKGISRLFTLMVDELEPHKAPVILTKRENFESRSATFEGKIGVYGKNFIVAWVKIANEAKTSPGCLASPYFGDEAVILRHYVESEYTYTMVWDDDLERYASHFEAYYPLGAHAGYHCRPHFSISAYAIVR